MAVGSRTSHVRLWDQDGNVKFASVDSSDFDGRISVEEYDPEIRLSDGSMSAADIIGGVGFNKNKDRRVKIRVEKGKDVQSYIMSADDALLVLHSLQGNTQPLIDQVRTVRDKPINHYVIAGNPYNAAEDLRIARYFVSHGTSDERDEAMIAELGKAYAESHPGSLDANGPTVEEQYRAIGLREVDNILKITTAGDLAALGKVPVDSVHFEEWQANFLNRQHEKGRQISEYFGPHEDNERARSVLEGLKRLLADGPQITTLPA